MSSYLKISNGSETKAYMLSSNDNNIKKPYLRVSGSVLPLTTRTTNGLHLNVKVGTEGQTVTITNKDSSSWTETQSTSSTFYTTFSNSNNMINISTVTVTNTNYTLTSIRSVRGSTQETSYYTASARDTYYYSSKITLKDIYSTKSDSASSILKYITAAKLTQYYTKTYSVYNTNYRDTDSLTYSNSWTKGLGIIYNFYSTSSSGTLSNIYWYMSDKESITFNSSSGSITTTSYAGRSVTSTETTVTNSSSSINSTVISGTYLYRPL